MRKFIEKMIIIAFCLANSYYKNPNSNLVLYFLISLIFSTAFDLLKSRNFRALLAAFFIALSIYDSAFIFYLPLIVYNLYLDFKFYILLTLPLFFLDFSLLNLLLAIVSVYMSVASHTYQSFVEEHKLMRDNLKEDALLLRKYNEQLKIDREKNIQIAILSERNRIARELHDSIGHVISSSILQVEALKISAQANTSQGLSQLQETLSHGMDEIRNSIHNLHKESFDLKNKIEELVDELPSIETKLNYRIEEELNYGLKFDILSIVREAITNCVKHSNASELKISLLSQPKFYSLLIEDNGSKYEENKHASGIGLVSMKEIADKYKGFLNYRFDNGFKIHISLMKG